MAVYFAANRLGQLFIICTVLQLTLPALATDNSKRVPSGFTGVRGKKSAYDDSNEMKNERSFELFPSDDVRPEYSSNPFEDSTNRDISNSIDFGYKRGPMGFVGMRGKKETFHNYNSQDALEKEIQKIRFNCKLYPDNFHCADVKPETIKPLLLENSQINSDDLIDPEEENYVGGQFMPYPLFSRTFEIKRAPMGFMGMRGKKYAEDGFNVKRVPSGFVGMRGKKAFLTDNPAIQVSEDPEQIVENNAYLSKRAPQAGFFGMRGKKMPGYSGFFGMRGKKGPYDFPFRGKFVGVRGKKSNYDAIESHVGGSTIGQE